MIQLNPKFAKVTRWVAPLVLLLVVLLLGMGAAEAEPRMARRDGGFEGSAGSGRAGLDCLIQPAILVELGSPVDGVIEEIHVSRGDLVEKGQLLVELESGVERVAVELARARAEMESQIRASEVSLALDQLRMARKDRLFQNSVLSSDARDEAETEALLGELQLQQARENRQLAELELARARAALRRRAIYSSFSGVVVDRMMEPGARVSEQSVLKLAQLDPLRVEVIAPAHLFGTIEKGMRAEIAAELPVGAVYPGTVKAVDPMVNAASGRFGLELELPNPDHSIPAGLRCRVELLSD